MNPAELIHLANTEVDITRAFGMIDEHVDYAASVSMKIYCPWGNISHADGGNTRSMRVYTSSNSAWCFAGCGYFDPVRLVADHFEFDRAEAAEWMLREIGYVHPDYESVWESLMQETPKVDTASLAAALKVACSRMHPQWESVQFEGPVLTDMDKCLRLLPKVHTSEEADRWLSVTKTLMRRTLENLK